MIFLLNGSPPVFTLYIISSYATCQAEQIIFSLSIIIYIYIYIHIHTQLQAMLISMHIAFIIQRHFQGTVLSKSMKAYDKKNAI